eukprot:TRINITY_DN4106_c0_g2_i4.p1 TRINITY_DN4106_c0_g2~~TRINITY_DN4106_c0_g2_i4.p1  ORF type:complete len:286 (-),score=19.07 TRINITY_DN4106_c0_g2_i4:99-956(-)
MRDIYGNPSSTFEDIREIYSNNNASLHKNLYQHYNRNACSSLDRANSLNDSVEHYDQKHNRFKNFINPKSINTVRRANYLREFDIPGAKPVRLAPLKGRDSINASDMGGVYPGRNKERNTPLASRVHTKPTEQEARRANEYCINFSNPHLERPKWHRNIRPKAESNNYAWAKPSIQKLLWPSWQDNSLSKVQRSYDAGSKTQVFPLAENLRSNGRKRERQVRKLLERFAGNEELLCKDSERSEFNRARNLSRDRTTMRYEPNFLYCTPQKSEYLKKSIEKMYADY